MPALTEQDRLGDLLKYEAPNLYSRDEVIVETGQTLVAGSVVALHNATDEIVELNPGAGSGQGNAYGIVTEEVDTSTATVKTWIIARHALVAEDSVIWPSGISANQLKSAIEELRALGIIIRKDI
ncbi:MAG: head decoration protein [Proteobacteria bacterium]|nr:head decoration protein [Pseudomonadota bacterium]